MPCLCVSSLRRCRGVWVGRSLRAKPHWFVDHSETGALESVAQMLSESPRALKERKE
jgi:hypothetical protein